MPSERRHIKKFMFGDCKKECGGHIFCFVWLRSQVVILAFIVGRFISLHPWESSVISNWLSVMSDSLRPHGLQPTRLLCWWDSPGQNTGVGSCSLLQGIFPTQGSNPGLPHCRWILYQMSHKGSPRILAWVAYPFSRELPDPGIKPGSSALQTKLFTSWGYQGNPFLKLNYVNYSPYFKPGPSTVFPHLGKFYSIISFAQAQNLGGDHSQLFSFSYTLCLIQNLTFTRIHHFLRHSLQPRWYQLVQPSQGSEQWPWPFSPAAFASLSQGRCDGIVSLPWSFQSLPIPLQMNAESLKCWTRPV